MREVELEPETALTNHSIGTKKCPHPSQSHRPPFLSFSSLSSPCQLVPVVVASAADKHSKFTTTTKPTEPTKPPLPWTSQNSLSNHWKPPSFEWNLYFVRVHRCCVIHPPKKVALYPTVQRLSVVIVVPFIVVVVVLNSNNLSNAQW